MLTQSSFSLSAFPCTLLYSQDYMYTHVYTAVMFV